MTPAQTTLQGLPGSARMHPIALPRYWGQACSVGLLFIYGALDSHPFFPSHVASGCCVLSAAAAGALVGVVSAFAEPSGWCARAVLDVAVCAVCASTPPSSTPPPPRARLSGVDGLHGSNMAQNGICGISASRGLWKEVIFPPFDEKKMQNIFAKKMAKIKTRDTSAPFPAPPPFWGPSLGQFSTRPTPVVLHDQCSSSRTHAHTDTHLGWRRTWPERPWESTDCHRLSRQRRQLTTNCQARTCLSGQRHELSTIWGGGGELGARCLCPMRGPTRLGLL